MTDLMNFSNEKTYTSVYLTEQINLYRGMEGDNAVLRHKSLLTKIEKEFSEEINEQNILPVKYKDAKGEMRNCYELNYEQSLQLLMSESKVVRKGVIKVLKQQQEIINNNLPQIPKTFAEALRFAADQEEQKEKALLELSIAKPKVDFVDSMIDNDYTTNFRDAAKLYGIKERKLIRLLEENNYLYRVDEPSNKGGATIRFYARGINSQLFVLEPWTNGKYFGNQTKLTTRGVAYFEKKIQGFIEKSKKLL